MAMCLKCSRPLPSNGDCLYCGKLETEGAYRKPRRPLLGPWIRSAVKLALAAGLCSLAYWMIFTQEGRGFTQKLKEMLGTAQEEESSPWVKRLKKYPKIQELLAITLNRHVEEEAFPDDPAACLVTITLRDGAELKQWAFIVNNETGEIVPQSQEAALLLSDP
ncbi:MAG: hypothetical protein HYY16_16405 [Planctomycetes bacterium]|nr:hypothetical protein [Planctomycetota bacterium]